jgi:hypothetical protein
MSHYFDEERPKRDLGKDAEVIDIFSHRKRVAEAASSAALADPGYFESAMAQNKANEERLRQERAKANSSTLRNYRISSKKDRD